jgi:hypothetical protein
MCQRFWKRSLADCILHVSIAKRELKLTCKINLAKSWKMGKKVVYLPYIQSSTSAASDQWHTLSGKAMI